MEHIVYLKVHSSAPLFATATRAHHRRQPQQPRHWLVQPGPAAVLGASKAELGGGQGDIGEERHGATSSTAAANPSKPRSARGGRRSGRSRARKPLGV